MKHTLFPVFLLGVLFAVNWVMLGYNIANRHPGIAIVNLLLMVLCAGAILVVVRTP